MSMMWQKLIAPTPAGGGGGPYSFNVTVGNLSSFYFGYSTSLSFGSIDAEPISGEVLEEFFWTNGGAPTMAFTGDILSLVDGLDVWLDGTLIAEAGDWIYEGGNDITTITGFEPTSLTSGTYLVELIAP